MSKRKAITRLIVILVIVAILAVFSSVSMQLGIYDYVAPIQNIPLGIELSGGVYVVFDVSAPDGAEYTDAELQANIQTTIGILQNRLLAAGYSEATVVEESSVSGTPRIRVEVADVGTEGVDSDEVFNIIGKPAVLEFRDSDNNVVLSGQKGHIKSAQLGYDASTGYLVMLKLNDEGTKLFADATTKAAAETYGTAGNQIAIYLDNEKISSPNVGEAITNGEAMISGNFTYEQANSLAIQIQGGALTVDLDIVEQSNASATLGENAITTSLLAAAIGLLLIFVFMFLVYGGLGLVADISLCIYSVIVIYILGTFSVVQLSLAGIAGIVLSIGMAVDANVIIFERIKDEYAMGKTIPASVQAGFKRATAAIVDSNITTIIACAVLYFLGSATIKAFAITLFVGIIVSMVCALLISRGLCALFLAINNTDNKFYKLESEVNING